MCLWRAESPKRIGEQASPQVLPSNTSLERTRDGQSAKLMHRRARRSTQPLNDSFRQSWTAASGRQDSSASGSLREANLQRRLSGDESGEVSVATRPRPGIRTSPKPPLSTGVFCEFRCHEAAVRDLTTPATSRHKMNLPKAAVGKRPPALQKGVPLAQYQCRWYSAAYERRLFS